MKDRLKILQKYCNYVNEKYGSHTYINSSNEFECGDLNCSACIFNGKDGECYSDENNLKIESKKLEKWNNNRVPCPICEHEEKYSLEYSLYSHKECLTSGECKYCPYCGVWLKEAKKGNGYE